jgi:hypothetical protein
MDPPARLPDAPVWTDTKEWVPNGLPGRGFEASWFPEISNGKVMDPPGESISIQPTELFITLT